jgi:hypothetical protein
MFGIGDFARHGRVSVRMLRHYDAIGLLQPAQGDPLTGYRSYDAGQLTQVEARLRLIEKEGAMPMDGIHLRRIPAIRVAELQATAPGFEPDPISPVIEPMYAELHRRLGAAGVRPVGPDVAWYEPRDDDGLTIRAAAPNPAHGYRSLGFNREVYLGYGCGGVPEAWVTELPEPVAAR